MLFIWELGENFGHAAKIATVANPLSAAAEVFVAARDPVVVRKFAPHLDAKIIAAPAAPRPKPGETGDRGESYSDNLRHCGWHEPDTLAALLESWRVLFDLVVPDMIVAQAAPSGLLAARGGPWRTALVGSGYDAPPRSKPMPSMRWWEPDAGASLPKREARIVETANAALDRLRLPHITAFRETLDTDVTLLASFEPLDHYRPRCRWEPDHPPYCGHLFEVSTGMALDWKDGARRRIFAYLRPGRPGFAQAEAAFANAEPDWDVILSAPGATPRTQAKLAAGGVRIVDGPVRLDRLLPRCDLAISHGSSGVSAAFLAAGVPQLALPSQAEQTMGARVLGDQGLGFGIVGRYGPREVRALIDRALEDEAMRKRVQATAAGLGVLSPVEAGSRMAEALQSALH